MDETAIAVDQGDTLSTQDSMGCVPFRSVRGMSPCVKDTSPRTEFGIKFIRTHWNGLRVSDHSKTGSRGNKPPC